MVPKQDLEWNANGTMIQNPITNALCIIKAIIQKYQTEITMDFKSAIVHLETPYKDHSLNNRLK